MYLLDFFPYAVVEAVGLWDAGLIRVPSACASNP
jgi:hypothetical protein